jgi:hypothetical protein
MTALLAGPIERIAEEGSPEEETDSSTADRLPTTDDGGAARVEAARARLRGGRASASPNRNTSSKGLR